MNEYPAIWNTALPPKEETFRYDVANWHEPRIILITELTGKRSECPRLGTVVLPHPRSIKF